MKRHAKRMVWCGCAFIAVCAFSARAVTGVWTNVSGGYWADDANWQGGVVPSSSGAEPGAGDVADFTALPVGETVTLTNYTAIGSLWFSGSAWVSPTRRTFWRIATVKFG